MTEILPQAIVTGLAFPECPRWHAGRLWFSDQHGGAVYRLDADGVASVVVEIPGGASGLGWLPDGSLLIVSMDDCRVLRFADGKVEQYADLRPYHQWHSNDMLVTESGYVYVGSIGFDYYNSAAITTSPLLVISPDRRATVAADGLTCPNGMIVTSDGATLVVAESLAGRLTAFDLTADGALIHRRTFVDLGRLVPDGMCRDDQGRVLFASIGQHAVVRVEEGTLRTVATTPGREIIACALGGSAGRTLYMCTTVSMTPEETLRNRDGRIEVVELPA